MTTTPATPPADDAAMQALSDAGAICGECGDEPGDRNCPDCERCYRDYVAALRKAGWAPRAETLNEAADAIDAETELAKGAGVLEPDRFRPCRDASAQLRRMAAAARPDNTEAHQPHVCYVLERAISDGWVEERVVDEPAAAAQAVEDYDAWWLLPATLRVVRRTSLSTVVSVHEVTKPGPCTCGHPHEQHLPICGRSRQCRSLCDCDAYRPDNTTGA